MIKPKTIILAHADCVDGLGACYAAWLHFKDNAEYVFMTYGDKLPDLTGKNVYMVDWSVKASDLDDILKIASSVTILDHHLSAQRELIKYLDRGDIKGIIDMKRSGAVIAWDYFHARSSMPRLFEYIQDRDLWKNELEDTNPIIHALYSYDLTLENMHMLKGNEDRLKKEGQPLIRVLEKAKKNAMFKFRKAEFNSHKILVINDTRSEILNHILTETPEVDYVVGYTDINDKVTYSLRSEDSRVDVSVVASLLGGGGHHNAAGCSSPLGFHFWEEL